MKFIRQSLYHPYLNIKVKHSNDPNFFLITIVQYKYWSAEHFLTYLPSCSNKYQKVEMNPWN